MFWKSRRTRIRKDNAILAIIIIFTGFLFWFKDLYPQSVFVDNAFDFIGMLLVLEGNLLRMAARGHKKKAPRWSLVTTGPYALVRNPMYLGSFEIGSGFVLIVWPWWGWPVFAVLFFLRFNRQMKKEEESLSAQEDKAYERYCRRTPRIIPDLKKLFKMRSKDIINLDEALNTKETTSLWAWLLGAFVLETFQQWVVFGQVDMRQTVIIFMAAGVVFVAGFIFYYQHR